MTSEQPTISSKFPEGYGDFAIQSSDNVICYFPSQVLSHVSSVFRDMLNVATPDEGRKSLPIDESIQDLENFLKHIDPNTFFMSIDPGNIQQLLMMADKYHVRRILQWFEHEATISRASFLHPKTQEPFTTAHPSLALELAIQFDFKDTGRAALREFAGKDLGSVLENDRMFSPLVIRQIYQMQRVRLEHYHLWISQLSAGYQVQCSNCNVILRKWFIRVIREMQRTPTWKSFSKLCREQGTVACRTINCPGITSPPSDPRYASWIEEAKSAESVPPEWPFSKPGDSDGAP
jgi:hypothetical protein